MSSRHRANSQRADHQDNESKSRLEAQSLQSLYTQWDFAGPKPGLGQVRSHMQALNPADMYDSELGKPEGLQLPVFEVLVSQCLLCLQ